MHITPKVAEALRAFAASPTRELVRCSGGYRAAGVAARDAAPITMRTVRAMNNEWLVQLHGPFSSGASLTDKGLRALAELLAPTRQARVG
ncbi:hypothetical protein H9645_03770 [Luteimonas sp. Sa2BVA3]|uniref:ArsR family transcriptional regulator n=1 Tax=Luteimonas colneyensis TaxID=2762230 RepID=A0ABR8UGI4_9GAMM|nr:hypothetical protein [Luteimonas colneyensis]MBD7987140.1 hypothetical protein [Luteimonas colneyensis]